MEPSQQQNIREGYFQTYLFQSNLARVLAPCLSKHTSRKMPSHLPVGKIRVSDLITPSLRDDPLMHLSEEAGDKTRVRWQPLGPFHSSFIKALCFHVGDFSLHFLSSLGLNVVLRARK